MAITKSAKKAIRQNARRKTHNLAYKNKSKGVIKQFKSLILQKKNDDAKKLLPEVYSILDKSAKVGIIKKNHSSRIKSRLTKMAEKASK